MKSLNKKEFISVRLLDQWPAQTILDAINDSIAFMASIHTAVSMRYAKYHNSHSENNAKKSSRRWRIPMLPLS